MEISEKPHKYWRYAFEFKWNQGVIDYCRQLKDRVGYASFGFCDKAWRFNSPEIGRLIHQKYPNVKLGAGFESLANDKVREMEAAREKDKASMREFWDLASSLKLTGIRGELRNYQKAAVLFAMRTSGRCFLALPPGLGKSLCALAYCAHTGKRKVIVACPSSIKSVWEIEVRKWTGYKARVIDKPKFTVEDFNSADVFIVSYDLLKNVVGKRGEASKKNPPWGLLNILKAFRWDALISDESQYVKESSTLRSKAFRALSRTVPSVMMLSGTPMQNRPYELWHPIDCMKPGYLGDFWPFAKQFCGWEKGRYGVTYDGATNTRRLRDLLRPVMLRYEKEDALPELPPKNFVTRPVDMTPDEAREYRRIEEGVIDEISSMDDSSAMAAAIAVLGRLRQFTSSVKAAAAEELVNELGENGEKCVVFSSFNAPLNALKEKLGGRASLLIGSTPASERGEQVRRFQEEPGVTCFLGGIRSAGAGITLTAAHNTIFVDQEWSPSDNRQAQDRTYRLGQESDKVNIFTLYVPGTVDEEVMETLAEKTKVIDEVIDGKAGGDEFSVAKKVLDKYRYRSKIKKDGGAI